MEVKDGKRSTDKKFFPGKPDKPLKCGSMIATELQDILFGTPEPVVGEVDFGVLKEDYVNIIVHGHEPLLSEMIVVAAEDPEMIKLAKEKGAKGINIAGICCTANEILMRHGIPLLGNFLNQELAITTGAIEVMAVDIQCIMQSLPVVASCYHTQIITTSDKAKIPGAIHVEFTEENALEKAKEVVKMAIESEKNGVDYLDVNIGPARKDGPQLMEWIINTIREVSNLPLSLDTTNVEAMKIGLEMEGDKAIINSIQATEERMNQLLPLATQFKCKLIALLVGKEGMPRDENERGALAAEFVAKIDEYGIEHSKVYFDPIVLPVRFQQEQVVSPLEFMKMFKDLFPDFNSTCGLSNVSNGAPENLRPLLNRTYLIMLEKYGMDSAIVDAFDTELINFAKGENKKIKELIWKALEEEIDISSLNEDEIKYVKTVKVLKGDTIYSDSWLNL
ncbi:dihydropteroate synthase [bacterium]|nr:dihydropteroate synthase [bacterium]